MEYDQAERMIELLTRIERALDNIDDKLAQIESNTR